VFDELVLKFKIVLKLVFFDVLLIFKREYKILILCFQRCY